MQRIIGIAVIAFATLTLRVAGPAMVSWAQPTRATVAAEVDPPVSDVTPLSIVSQTLVNRV